jgi:hypothetical protein
MQLTVAKRVGLRNAARWVDVRLPLSARPLAERIEDRVREWNITVATTLETERSFLAFGTTR